MLVSGSSGPTDRYTGYGRYAGRRYSWAGSNPHHYHAPTHHYTTVTHHSSPRTTLQDTESGSVMQHYRRMIHQYDVSLDDYDRRFPKDEAYVDKMEAILSAYPIIGVPREPTPIAGGVYVGSTANAENIALLKQLGIKYILNCAGSSGMRYQRIRQFYTPESGVQGYEELGITDSETADITSHLERAHMFIDYARSKSSKVLIHCPGVSRSGAIALSYMVRNGTPLLQATQVLKQQRRCALTNEGFMRQLVRYARRTGRLEVNPGRVTTPQYHSRLNSYRISTAHLPLQL